MDCVAAAEFIIDRFKEMNTKKGEERKKPLKIGLSLLYIWNGMLIRVRTQEGVMAVHVEMDKDQAKVTTKYLKQVLNSPE